jgi:hypothetical protein
VSFVDIGGDRDAPAVARTVSAVAAAGDPSLIVVKSRNLFAALAPHISSTYPRPGCGPQPPAVPPGFPAWLSVMDELLTRDPESPPASPPALRLPRCERNLARRLAKAAALAHGRAAERGPGTAAASEPPDEGGGRLR